MIPSGQVGHLHLKCGRNLVQAQREDKRSIFPQVGLRCGRCWMARCRARFTTRPETAASQPHTDYSRVDRVESVALLDAKRPYSTLMFSRKERKGRKERTPWDAAPDLITTSCQIIWLPAQDHYCQGGLTPQFRGKSAAPVSASARKQPLRGTRSHSYTVKHIRKGRGGSLAALRNNAQG